MAGLIAYIPPSPRKVKLLVVRAIESLESVPTPVGIFSQIASTSGSSPRQIHIECLKNIITASPNTVNPVIGPSPLTGNITDVFLKKPGWFGSEKYNADLSSGLPAAK